MESRGGNFYTLIDARAQMHLDAPFVFVVNRLMRERANFEIGAQFAIDPADSY